MQYFGPTFTHGGDGAPGLVGPAGDGAAAFDLLTSGTSDTDRLANGKHLRGPRSAAGLPPAGRSRARQRWKEQKCGIINEKMS